MENVIPSVGLRFFLALLLGAAVAGIFGILIGIPVLRLKGDYLAIVTLAFGEIIKNLINAMYVGRDSTGFHFSIKDTLSLGMAIPMASNIKLVLSKANFCLSISFYY